MSPSPSSAIAANRSHLASSRHLMPKSSYARLDTWARAQIVTYHECGLRPTAIIKKVRKKDGTKPTVRGVRKTIAKKKLNPDWRGQNAPGGPGRKAIISEAQKTKLYNLVFAERGAAYVCIKYCQQRIPSLRDLSRWVIARALHAIGLKWLRRRQKRWVRPEHIAPRLKYARWVLRQPALVLKSFAFMDGTTYYLARGPADAAQKKRGRLGLFVWRRSTAADGLYNDNVGPSLYAAKQGRPVKVWGFLANGKLCVYVLPASGDDDTTHMNGRLLRWMITRYAKQWISSCWARPPAKVRLVMDYEGCLRQTQSLECFRQHGLHAQPNFPKQPRPKPH